MSGSVIALTPHDPAGQPRFDARAAFEPLRALSYVHTPHRANIAHHFSKHSGRLGEVTHGLHLTEPSSDLWRERFAFRDALRADRVSQPSTKR